MQCKAWKGEVVRFVKFLHQGEDYLRRRTSAAALGLRSGKCCGRPSGESCPPCWFPSAIWIIDPPKWKAESTDRKACNNWPFIHGKLRQASGGLICLKNQCHYFYRIAWKFEAIDAFLSPGLAWIRIHDSVCVLPCGWSNTFGPTSLSHNSKVCKLMRELIPLHVWYRKAGPLYQVRVRQGNCWVR